MYALADCNNFFASCERVFRPDLAHRPVIVLSNNDGCAIARSEEAKALGIRMGDPLFKIRDIVARNNVAVFSGNMALYGDMSRRVRYVLEEFAPSVEVYSIDEAFLDLNGMEHIDFDAYAKHISAQCLRLTAIPVSVGIAPTKTLAKIASKLCKKYPKLRGGCYMHRPEDVAKVLSRFPVEDVWGIGRKSARKLHEGGVRTAADFVALPEGVVRNLFGISGVRTWRELRGEPCIEFEDTIEPKQSICVSRSFATEIKEPTLLAEQVANFAASVADKLRRQHSVCQEMVVFAFTNRFNDNAPRHYGSLLVPFAEPTNDHRTIIAAAVNATRELFKQGYGYKKAGVVASKLLAEGSYTPSLFVDTESLERESKLSAAMDTINQTYGRGAVRLASQGSGHIHSSSQQQSPHYTTRWEEIPRIKQ